MKKRERNWGSVRERSKVLPRSSRLSSFFIAASGFLCKRTNNTTSHFPDGFGTWLGQQRCEQERKIEKRREKIEPFRPMARYKSIWNRNWITQSVFTIFYAKFSLFGGSSLKQWISTKLIIMAIQVVEFSNGGYKIRKIFA